MPVNVFYWAGPYDGEQVRIAAGVCRPLDTQLDRLAVRVKDRQDEAGQLVVAPLGTFEDYRWCSDHRRYEWHGTRHPTVTE